MNFIEEYKGIKFDDWTIDEYGKWAEMCEECAEKYKNVITNELDDGGTARGCCSVLGCKNTGESIETNKHYYFDFQEQEIIK